MNSVESHGNRIDIVGRVGLLDFHRVLAALHGLVVKRECREVVLNFEACTAAYNGPMLSICSAVSSYRFKGVDTSIVLPVKEDLRRRFRNTNWAYLMDPGAFEQSTYRGELNVPAIPFSSPAEQSESVNRMLDGLLGNLPGLERPDLAAVEWALNEITDNVLTHAESAPGGIVQLSNLRSKGLIEFSVSDAGVGIPASLRRGHPGLRSDAEALDLAIREGVTKDPKLGQGNGLFGTYRVASLSAGYFHVHSGYARLDLQDGGARVRTESIPCVGTLVVVGVNRSERGALEEALRFNARHGAPIDYVETHFEGRGASIVFAMHSEAASFGSRIAGTRVRTKLENLAKMNPSSRIIVEMSEVPFCSSSFADEVFGKLFVSLGALAFMARFELRGVQPTVRALVDRAIAQRSTSEA
jgi:anti-sigma regulatory factor (Ser/Thr protein kinase)